MPETKIYNGLITDEGISQARQAKGNIGWYIIPTEYGISDVKGAFTASRTISQVNSMWYRHSFNSISDVSYLEKNKLMFTITIPGNAFSSQKTISEIYFFAKTPQDTEYLYVLIQPINPMSWSPGVTQKMSFVISLSNSDKGDIYNIQFSSPEDIEDHNSDLLAHPHLLARDGSRNATGVLRYADKLDFSNPRDIPDLEFVLNAMPTGFMTWWAFPTPPAGYLVRNGAAISRTAYSALNKLHADAGYPFGSGDGVTTFNLADDRDVAIRGWNNSSSDIFGGIKNIPSSAPAIDYNKGLNIGNNYTCPSDGLVYLGGTQDNWSGATINGVSLEVSFDTGDGQSRGNLTLPVSKGDKLTGFSWIRTAMFFPGKTDNASKERCYLPIIKY